MILTSDGRMFVYGVFGADGYECKFLHRVFEDEEVAKRHVEMCLKHEASGMPFSDEFYYYGKPELLTVEMLEVSR